MQQSMSERERAKGLLKELGMSERRQQLYGEGIDRADETELAAASHGLEKAFEEAGAALETAGQILGRRTNRDGELERRRAFLIAWIEREPRETEPLYQLCEFEESISRWDDVAATAIRLAHVTEGEPQVAAAMRAADALTRAGRPADAVPVLEGVHQNQPSASVVRDALREVYGAAGELRSLARLLVADADHGSDPAQRFADYKRAAELYLYHFDDPRNAQRPAQRALELQPDDHAALMLHVDVLLQSGELEDAGRTLEAAIAAQKRRTPELAVLQQRMGRVAAALGDRDGQLHWLKKAFDVDRKNAEVAGELARLATEIGDYELALKPLRAITLMDDPAPVTRPMALLWEARIESARGNRAKAEMRARNALREDPAFSDAQQFLDKLDN